MSGLGDWPALDEQARRVVLDQLLEKLPSWLELAEPGVHLRFRDSRSGETWRLFHGGPVTIGATLERLAAVEDFQRLAPMTLFDPTAYLPTREVKLSPFLLMETVIMEGEDPRTFFNDIEGDQAALLTERGQRLPTEAEWEFAWWAVQHQRENWRPMSSELCADGWRPHLLELSDVNPKVPGGPAVVRTASFDAESLHAIMPTRLPLSLVRLVSVRPALDVPML